MMKQQQQGSAAVALDAGKKRPSMDLGVHDQDRTKRVKDTGDKAAAAAAAHAAGAMQFAGGAGMPGMPMVPPGAWPYPSSFPLMPPMGMPFCFPPAFFPGMPFMFPPFWFANAMSAMNAAGGMTTAAGAGAPGAMPGSMPVPGAAAGCSMPGMPQAVAMPQFPAMPMQMQMMQPAAAMSAAAAAMAPMAPAAAAAKPLPASMLQQLMSPAGGACGGGVDSSMPMADSSCLGAPASCGAVSAPAPVAVASSSDCCGSMMSSDAVTPTASDGSIAAPGTPEVNDMHDQDFVSFIDSFLNLPDDGLGCTIPLEMGSEDDHLAAAAAAAAAVVADVADELNPLGLGLKLSKSESLLNLLDHELACAANASPAGFGI